MSETRKIHDIDTIKNHLLQKATEVAEAVQKLCRFRADKEVIEFVRVDGGKDFLTRDGVWTGNYMGKTYTVHCTVEEIFNLYLAAWKIDNGYAPRSTPDKGMTEEAKLKVACDYFKIFACKVMNIYEAQDFYTENAHVTIG